MSVNIDLFSEEHVVVYICIHILGTVYFGG